jgi:hypothetical protein
MKPNKKNIRKWVEALRSGKFKQTSGSLKRGDAYCCLGVACEISGLFTGWKLLFPYADTAETVKEGVNETTLPRLAMDWLGVDETDPTLLKRSTPNTAAELNDYGKSFKQIATYIERKYLKD